MELVPPFLWQAYVETVAGTNRNSEQILNQESRVDTDKASVKIKLSLESQCQCLTLALERQFYLDTGLIRPVSTLDCC